jgi:hypothetical protein
VAEKIGRIRKPCVFCGKEGVPFAKEDILAKWLTKDFRKSWATITNIKTGHRFKARGQVGLVSRTVCKSCNNGWMSDLEHDTQPILKPLIFGQAKTLSEDDQLILTSWLMKTSMMLEFLPDSTSNFFNQTDREQFCQTSSIPPNTRMFLARWAPSHVEMKTRNYCISGKAPNDFGDFMAFITTLALGHVILQLFSVKITPLPEGNVPVLGIALQHYGHSADVQIWPVASIGHFPPPLRIAEPEFDSFSDRWKDFHWIFPR